MKEFFTSLVAVLSNGGYLKSDVAAAAVNDLTAQSEPLLKSLVAEVKAEIDAAEPNTDDEPATAAPSLKEQVAEMSDEERAELRETLGIAEVVEGETIEAVEDPRIAEMSETVTALREELKTVKGAISAARAGRTVGTTPAAPASNGSAEVDPSPEVTAKADKASAKYKWVLDAYNAGNLDAETFKAATGHDAPKRR